MSHLPDRRREELPSGLDWMLRVPEDDDADGVLIVINAALSDDDARAAEKEALAAYRRERLRRRGLVALPLLGVDHVRTAAGKRPAASAAVAVVVASIAIAAAVVLPKLHQPSHPQALPSTPNRPAPSSAPAKRPPSTPADPSPSRPDAPPTASPGHPTIKPITRHKARSPRHRSRPSTRSRPPHTSPTRPVAPITPPVLSPAGCGVQLNLGVVRVDLQVEVGRQGLLCPHSR